MGGGGVPRRRWSVSTVLLMCFGGGSWLMSRLTTCAPPTATGTSRRTGDVYDGFRVAVSRQTPFILGVLMILMGVQGRSPSSRHLATK